MIEKWGENDIFLLFDSSFVFVLYFFHEESGRIGRFFGVCECVSEECGLEIVFFCLCRV